MRLRLSETDRLLLFSKLAERGFTPEKIANELSVSTRMIYDWRRGKYTMPQARFLVMVALAGIGSTELGPEVLDPWWHNATAGKLGASARLEKYGNPGTPEGRRKGGYNSFLNNRHNPNSIYSRKAIVKPGRNERFAEFIGILIGDGNLTKYQVAIANNTVDDREYILFIAALMQELFATTPQVVRRKNVNCSVVVASSIRLVEYLKKHGVVAGDKLRQNLDIPPWILEDRAYSIACLRGIFDTDGGIFLERHKVNGKTYCYPRLSFVTMSYQLRLSISRVLTDMDFSPKIRNNRSVNLENRSDIERYFDLIGTSNPKHARRWKEFGGVG